MRHLVCAIALVPSGCTAIAAGSISSVNMTVGEEISHSQAGYTGVLIGAAVIDITILVAAVVGEDIALNERELATELARGQGRFVTDLAATLELPASEIPRVGEALRRHRDNILGAIRQSATPALKAQTLRAAIETALAEDPWLHHRLMTCPWADTLH